MESPPPDAETQTQSLGQEDPTRPGVAEPMNHNNQACILEPGSHATTEPTGSNHWSLRALEPGLRNQRNHDNEKLSRRS